MFGVGSGAAVSAASGVRVVRGGGVSGSPSADGAADDGAPQALSITSATSRIPASVLMRGIILHRIFAATRIPARPANRPSGCRHTELASARCGGHTLSDSPPGSRGRPGEGESARAHLHPLRAVRCDGSAALIPQDLLERTYPVRHLTGFWSTFTMDAAANRRRVAGVSPAANLCAQRVGSGSRKCVTQRSAHSTACGTSIRWPGEMKGGLAPSCVRSTAPITCAGSCARTGAISPPRSSGVNRHTGGITLPIDIDPADGFDFASISGQDYPGAQFGLDFDRFVG